MPLLAMLWLAFLIGFRYSGHESGLFYTGRAVSLPRELEPHTFRVADDVGYDGQYYHLIAHDPWNRRGFILQTDNPAFAGGASAYPLWPGCSPADATR